MLLQSGWSLAGICSLRHAGWKDRPMVVISGGGVYVAHWRHCQADLHCYQQQVGSSMQASKQICPDRQMAMLIKGGATLHTLP
jgi:hypothetical protein